MPRGVSATSLSSIDLVYINSTNPDCIDGIAGFGIRLSSEYIYPVFGVAKR